MANNNSAVHILFVCGMGMGTSTMAELGVKRNLVPLKITAELQHTSLGMMESLRDWADIIVILKISISRSPPGKTRSLFPWSTSWTARALPPRSTRPSRHTSPTRRVKPHEGNHRIL